MRWLAASVVTVLLAGAPTARAAVSFTPAMGSPFATGDAPSAVVTGDFNNDFRPDVATADTGADTVTVLLYDKQGLALGIEGFTFSEADSRAVGDQPAAIATGDVDEDGNLDLAVANSGDDTVSVLLGQGDGTFTAGATLPVGDAPAGIEVGRFSADLALDLVVANAGSDTLSVLLGDGNGGFTAAASPATGDRPSRVAAGRFDDGFEVDLAVANRDGESVSILLGDGDGTFTAGPTIELGAKPFSLDTGDIDGDADDDVVASLDVAGKVGVLLSDDDGSFTAAPDLTGFDTPQTVVLGYFAHEGDPLDLAVANGGGSSVSVLGGNGDGSFNPAAEPETVSSPVGLAATDFLNEDLHFDLVATSPIDDEVDVLFNDGPRGRLSGSGATVRTPVNTFTIFTNEPYSGRGLLRYVGATRTFVGGIRCFSSGASNTVTIVAEDRETGFLNRTMVQDNGESGDKLVNTMFQIGRWSQETIYRWILCVPPDLARLNAAPPLAGDPIHVHGKPFFSTD